MPPTLMTTVPNNTFNLYRVVVGPLSRVQPRNGISAIVVVVVVVLVLVLVLVLPLRSEFIGEL